jgi:hypothetical protein
MASDDDDDGGGGAGGGAGSVIVVVHYIWSCIILESLSFMSLLINVDRASIECSREP